MLDSKYYEDETFEAFSKYKLESNEFIECTFKGIDLSEADLSSARFIECKFEKCNLSNTRVVNTSFRDVQFIDCKLMGINWSTSKKTTDLNFSKSLLDYSVFQSLQLPFIIFEECSLKEVDFSGSTLTSAVFTESNLLNSVFSNADLTTADLRSAINYYIDPEFTKIKNAMFSMPEAMAFFKALNIIVE